MTPHEAKLILLAWRPGAAHERDPEVVRALECARREPELRSWLEGQKSFQQKLKESLRTVPVPEGLAERILSQVKRVPPVGEARHRPRWWTAAAAVLLLGLFAWWMRPAPTDAFPQFRDRMVRTVVRQYSMDIVTNDKAVIRRFLATNQAPSNYVLPRALARLPVIGAGLLRWRDQRVAMVCLDSGEQGTLFLFVVESAAVLKAPGPTPDFVPVSKLTTASWTEGGKTYVLAGTGGEEALGRYW